MCNNGLLFNGYGPQNSLFLNNLTSSLFSMSQLDIFNVVVVRLEHSHSSIDSFDNHSTASGLLRVDVGGLQGMQ